MTDKPKGIGAIFTAPNGEVYAHAFDFNLNGYGGFKLWEAQRIRAKKAVIGQFISKWTYGDVASVMDDYDAEKIVTGLCQKKNYRMTYVNIGHQIEDSDLNR